MYKMLESVQNDFHSPDEYRKKLAFYFQKEFFDGQDGGRTATYDALKKQKVPSSKYVAYLQCAKLNTDSIKETLGGMQFKNAYHKAAYILGILKRYSAGAEVSKCDDDYDPREMY